MNQAPILWLFFGLKGRISRVAFLLGGLLMTVVTLFVLYRMSAADAIEAGDALEFWNTVLSVVVFVSLWCQAALAAKRLHDIGRPGIFAIAMFVPLVNFIAFVALCLIPGEPGPNKYGAVTNAPN
ncbi:DUF805 domain-containing protein [Aliihoeflea aestuarii]|uniref:DUF805 domain-containing protein n=1 Tax=Aliihoeflea aestuarii TaxID=453840 RepID=UPI0020922BEB|nr:DUF805 domain-containing protein [Aliihoeflea aestuarii]MCO6390210.1 DUF805 domain-containing protein [Aliihoeflea aestuarii]